jgi:hypothetical protein
MSEGSGVPPTGEEQRRVDQLALVAGVVEDALRLMPVPSGGAAFGQGQGDGPDPKLVEAVAESVLELHDLLAPNTPILDWLTDALSSASTRAPGDPTVAAVAVRDLLLAGIDPGPDIEPPDSEAEATEETKAADVFLSGTIETA